MRAKRWTVPVWVGLLAVMAATVAVADEGTEYGSRRSASLSPPYRVLFRSMVVPGWGQLENDQQWKAALVAMVEGGFLAAGFVELRRSDRAFEAHTAAAIRGDQGEAERQFIYHQDRHARAVGHFWWGAFALMISALDAYVDAHLRDFRSDQLVATPGVELPAAASSPAVPAPIAFRVAPVVDAERTALALCVRF